jgi:hypothetical protein
MEKLWLVELEEVNKEAVFLGVLPGEWTPEDVKKVLWSLDGMVNLTPREQFGRVTGDRHDPSPATQPVPHRTLRFARGNDHSIGRTVSLARMDRSGRGLRFKG